MKKRQIKKRKPATNKSNLKSNSVKGFEINQLPPLTTVLVNGEKLEKWPQDLYIPPDALEIFLETFQGPLDLLLYLIRKQNLDILDIPVSQITQQYMEYVELMRHFRLDLAAEYLLMAAMLAEIKSRMLLPRPSSDSEEDEEDPRAALVRRLQEYEQYSQAAQELHALPLLERDMFLTIVEVDKTEKVQHMPTATLNDLAIAFRGVVDRSFQFKNWTVGREGLSVREKMTRILERIQNNRFIRFEELLTKSEKKSGVVVNFIAILELVRDRMLSVVQNKPFDPIHLKGIEDD